LIRAQTPAAIFLANQPSQICAWNRSGGGLAGFDNELHRVAGPAGAAKERLVGQSIFEAEPCKGQIEAGAGDALKLAADFGERGSRVDVIGGTTGARLEIEEGAGDRLSETIAEAAEEPGLAAAANAKEHQYGQG
jgi:hypothetical protein